MSIRETIGAEVPRRPTDVGDDAVRREAQDAAATIEDLLGNIAAEADPVLDLLLMPDQFDVGERLLMEARCDHDAPPSEFSPVPAAANFRRVRFKYVRF